MAAHHIQPAFGGALGALFRHKTGRMGAGIEGNIQHLLGGGHFKIQWPRQAGLETCDVLIPNMAAVLTQMRCDAIGTCRNRLKRGPHRVRPLAAARIAHRRHMINIHTQTQAGHILLPRISTLSLRAKRSNPFQYVDCIRRLRLPAMTHHSFE